MRIALLGPVAAFDADGESLALGGPKQRAVIAMLALQPRGVVSTDALSDGLWGDRLPPHPRRTLSVYVSTLSKAPDDSVHPSAGGRRIVRVAPCYRLSLADTDVDAAGFQTAAAHAEKVLRRGRPLHARSRL